MSLYERGRHQIFPFHLVEESPWPLVVSWSLWSTMALSVFSMHNYISNKWLVLLSLLALLMGMGLWFRDIIIEGTYKGNHTIAVRKGLSLGFILFIVSEIFAFAGIFWAYFHSAMSPNIELGAQWPPVGIEAIGPTELPLLNTIILLSSGAVLTWGHHAILNHDRNNSIKGLLYTIILAILFLICQYFEYINSTFTISDGVYGSVFYAGTGTHFLHVLVGTIMLAVGFWRLVKYHTTDQHHIGLETSILYWHFVDIVWLFLFIVFYWWGS